LTDANLLAPSMINLPNKHCCLFLLLSVFLLAASPAMIQRQSSRKTVHSTEAVIVWNRTATAADSIDQESYAAMVASMGFTASKRELQNLDSAEINPRTLLLVPQASSRSLSPEHVRSIVGGIEKGLRLVTGGEGPLLSALHFRLGKSRRVGTVIDQVLPGNHLHWADRPRGKWIAGLPGLPTQVLYSDSSSGHPLVVSGSLGKGKYIVLAPHLDALSGQGYSRFPTLVNAIASVLNVQPPFKRRAVDAYFDPGYRLNTSIEELAGLWHQWGIRAVHASAWYYNSTPRYDYKRLIDAAHKNGILVYAWLEWPHVGYGFWNQHPEWRQKTALLQDAKLDWLRLMDLQNPDCMAAALNELSQEMELDWDGVDIAEFTITGAGGEALEGPSRPDYFTSFGTSMRSEFSKLGGFDPLELENPNSVHFWKRDSVGLEKFFSYRKVVNNRLLRQVVEFVVNLEKKGSRDWELIHTIVDNTLHPEFDHLLGFDLKATLALLKEFNITLNVEDPYMEWTEPPIRYRRLRQTLASLIPERNSMIDINVVPIHPLGQRGFPSEQATGTEFLQQAQAAAERNGRVCVYCESSVFEHDWSLVPGAMSTGSTVQKNADGWEVCTPATVVLDLEIKGLSPVLDGKLWPCYGRDGVILPAGTHQLSFAQKDKPPHSNPQSLRVMDIGGELIECRKTSTGLELTYVSPSRCLVTFDTLPKGFLLDDSSADLPVLRSKGRFVVLAPSGRHKLSIQAP
jgi:hypothetical protein